MVYLLVYLLGAVAWEVCIVVKIRNWIGTIYWMGPDIGLGPDVGLGPDIGATTGTAVYFLNVYGL